MHMADKKAETKKQVEPTQPTEREKALNDTGMADLVGKDIDQRMAELLEDHKRMGVR
jgi:hypothetical protein